MAYSASADIQADFPSVTFSDDAASKVKLANIPSYIADADALIDSYLATRYTVPVTGNATAVNLLRFYSRSLVSDKIKGLLEIKQATNQATNQNVRTGLSTKDIIKILEDYRDGTAVLPGAELGNPLVAAATFSSGGIGSQTTRFVKDEEQW